MSLSQGNAYMGGRNNEEIGSLDLEEVTRLQWLSGVEEGWATATLCMAQSADLRHALAISSNIGFFGLRVLNGALCL
jgi:hypothetical protein